MKDIFKKSFLEGFASAEISMKFVVMAVGLAFVLSLYVFFLYKNTTRKSFYNKNFNISLVFVACITSAIICTVQSSVVVSLGMVGALSIVRFRTAIKDPMDLAFLFWSISIGIICGAGFAMFAVILSIVLTIAIVLLDRIPMARLSMLLVVNLNDNKKENEVIDIIKNYSNNYKIQSRNMTSSNLDLTIELRTNNGNKLMLDLVEKEYVKSANLIANDGETSF